MKRVLAVAVPVAVAAAGLAPWVAPRERARAAYDEAVVRRGDLVRVQREAGVLQSRDSLPLKSAIEGNLEWVIRDGEWVNAGDRLYVLNVDEALVQVTSARTEVLGLQQELSLEKMRRRLAEDVEDQKIRAAERQRELAAVRYRILAAEPRGGQALVELHERLAPIEKETAGLRERYEELQDACQSAQDAYLAWLDRAQEKRDAVQYHQNRIEEYRIRAQTGADGVSAEETARRDEAAAGLEESRSALQACEAALPGLERGLREAEEKRDRARAPRDEAAGALAAREAEEKELYIQLEIEKRGVERAQLGLDRDIVRLRLEEAAGKLSDGRQAFDSGAISRTQLEKLEAERRAIETELKILDEKIAIASRPEPEETLTEARLKMEQAEAQVAKARELRDRALAAIDQKINVLTARMLKRRYDVDQALRAFPEVIEFTLKFLRREREGLSDTPEDRERAREIEEQVAQLEQDLARARAEPPNVARSPFAGVVRIMGRWGRPYQTGDRVAVDEVVMELFAATNLEARAYVTEAGVGSLREGMAARVLVPALRDAAFAGSVSHVSQVGRDRTENEETGARGGLMQFELRIRIDDVVPALRPGMTAIAEVETARATGVVHVARAAIRGAGGAYACLRRRGEQVVEQPVAGRVFSETDFIVESGLREGDVLLIERRRDE